LTSGRYPGNIRGMYSHVEKVSEVGQVEANQLLREGWQLINTYKIQRKLAETKDGTAVYGEVMMYVMGKIKDQPPE